MAASLRTVFCDDIRQENNGKVLLIGVYADNLQVSHMPARLPLSAWIRLYDLPQGASKLVLRFLVNGVEQRTANIEINVADSDAVVNAYLVGVPLELDMPGAITLEVAVADGDVIGTDVLHTGLQGAADG